jgi:NDP-sugar pyrophosphorylase family protein
MIQFERLVAIVLCGGMGTRLKKRVNDRPKSLAEIGGKPFLDYQIQWLIDNQIKRVYLAAGHMGEMVKDYVQKWKNRDISIEVIMEPEPLGTGGAVMNIHLLLESNCKNLLVINGDTFLSFNIEEMYRHHSAHRGLLTMAVSCVKNSDRYTGLSIEESMITGVSSDQKVTSEVYVHAGAYIISRILLADIPLTKFSMEADLLPGFISQGKVNSYILPKGDDANFFDYGIPEAYDEITQVYFNRRDAE